MDDLKRREFLKLGGAAVVAGATPLAAAKPPSRLRDGAVQRGADRDGAHRLRRHRRPGIGGTSGTCSRFPAAGSPPSATSAPSAPTGRRSRSPPPGSRRRPPTPAARATSSGCARPRSSISSTTRRRGSGTCPIMLAAMKNGKHTATEVPAAMTRRRLLGDRRSRGEASRSTAC